MGFITDFAVNTLMKTAHPTLKRAQCWTVTKRSEPCTRCMDICPHQVIGAQRLIKSWDPCTDCGLCVGVCKTQCLAPSGDMVVQNTEAADLNGDTIWIGCDKSKRTNDLVRNCICALPWQNLAYLLLCKDLVLDIEPCASCTNQPCAEGLKRNLNRVMQFVGVEFFSQHVTLATSEEQKPYVEHGVSRRDMFKSSKNLTRTGTRQLLRMLPGQKGEDETDHSGDFALLLAARVNQLKQSGSPRQPARYVWNLPKINENCYGCNRCTNFCKTKAIEVRDSADGTSRICVTPYKCTECGLCQTTCLKHAIEGLAPMAVPGLGMVSVHSLVRIKCTECGRVLEKKTEDGLCVSCHSKKVREENRLRREQEMAEKRAQQEAQVAAAQAPEVSSPVAGS